MIHFHYTRYKLQTLILLVHWLNSTEQMQCTTKKTNEITQERKNSNSQEKKQNKVQSAVNGMQISN